MTTQIIPVRPVPNQRLIARLGGRETTIKIEQRRFDDAQAALYITVETPDLGVIVSGAPLLHAVNVIPPASQFSGRLAIVDTRGTSDPDYQSLGGRFKLCWTE